MGTQKGDEEELRLLGPDGAILFEKMETLERAQAVRYRLGGVKRKGSILPAGRYVGEYQLRRRHDGQSAATTAPVAPAAEVTRMIQVQ